MKKEKIPLLLQREGEDTYPKLLLRNYKYWGSDKLALRKKQYGVWKGYTWSDCYEKVKAYFLGMLAVGMVPEDRVVILGDNCPEWFWFELAVQSGRGTVVSISPGASAEKTRYLIGRAKPKFAIAQDQEQVDKLLEIHRDDPFEKIIYWSDKGLRHYKDPVLIGLNELVKVGQSENIVQSYHPSHFEQTLALGGGDNVALVFYAARSEGMPEEVQATHKLLIESAEKVISLNEPKPNSEYVSLMNPGWFFEQTLGFGAALLIGQRLNFAENIETSMDDFREISPHTLIYPAQLWDKLAMLMQMNLANSGRLKNMLSSRNLAIGYRVSDMVRDEQKVNLLKSAMNVMAGLTGFRPLKDKHGLNNVKIAYAAGSSVKQETIKFFNAIGIDLKQLYASVTNGIVYSDPGENRIEQQFN